MVSLRFSPDASGAAVSVGPAPWFRVTRNVVHRGPDEAVVGELSDRQWVVAGRRYARLEIERGSTFHFEGALGAGGTELGPFQAAHLDAGELHADGNVLATFDEGAQLWRSEATGDLWPVLVVTAPKKATFTAE